ncbi:hypothetical protein F4825DRAFT_463160 [Nemania diffusa]|nr:hypothetical protein F4825DRAFT_463160 [Nemania diffusa]
MTALTKSASSIVKWGKETEKNMRVSHTEGMYLDTIPWQFDRFRELLEKHSKIPHDEVEAEIFKIRDKAWEIVNYPCIGAFNFVRLLEFEDDYPNIRKAIERLKAPGSQETFLEFGGFLFQTIRQLTFEGVDSARLYGTDLHTEFIELGYELFRDRDTLKATFVAGDMLLPHEQYAVSDLPNTLAGKVTIMHASNFFHLFTWESQLVLCEPLIQLLRLSSDATGPAMIMGSHCGSIRPGVSDFFSVFLHDESTFQSLWDTVGSKTGTHWKVSQKFISDSPPKPSVFNKYTRTVQFVVTEVKE